MAWRKRLEHYRDESMHAVEGWVQKDLIHALAIVQEFHEQQNIHGHMVEIGVHHGKFALALDTLRSPGEKLMGIDIFDDQHLNIDGSGRGSREIWDGHLVRLSHEPSSVFTKMKDSTQLAPDEIEKELGGKVRVFSIDGGHTMEQALNDLEIAAAALTNGGVVVLDDFCSTGFAGVTEAVFRYLFFHTPKLLPFGHIGGRLLFTTPAYRQTFHQTFLKKTAHMDRKFRVTPIVGYPTLVITARSNKTAAAISGASAGPVQ